MAAHLPNSSWEVSVPLRDWQKTALEKWDVNFNGVVRVVTGGGKTIFAFHCMLSFIKRFSQGEIIVIVPTVSLLDQWYVSLIEDLHVSKEEIACYSGQEKSEKLRRVNLFVINTARDLGHFITNSNSKFLIVDECHRAGSLMNSQALNIECAATLGLSATPEREYDAGFEELVSPVLGPVIFDYGYVEAFRDRVISPFELVNVKVSLLADEDAQFKKLTARAARELRKVQSGDASDELLKNLLLRRSRVSSDAVMRIPVAAKLVDQNRGIRTLLFHERIASSQEILRVVQERKHSATIYNTKISPVVRRDNLRLFRRGAFDVLVSCRALDEGTNIPEAAIAIIASSTASRRQRIQRLGRVLRPAPGKRMATIYTLYATDQEEDRLRQEEVNFSDIAKIQWVTGARR